MAFDDAAPPPPPAPSAARAASTMGEPLRWRIMELIAGEELCVRHLAEELAVPQPLVSHHLRVLARAGLVRSQRVGSCTYYRMEASGVAALQRELEALLDRSSALAAKRPC